MNKFNRLKSLFRISITLFTYTNCLKFAFSELVTLHSVIILIKSAFNKDKNHYYFKIF